MHQRELPVVRGGMTGFGEWICEMQGEIKVACAAASALPEEDIGWSTPYLQDCV
jgi:hypothetical protein